MGAISRTGTTPRAEPATWSPTGQASVAVEIGPGRGALVLKTSARWVDREVELVWVGEPSLKTHVAVRERQLPGGSIYAGLFGSLAAGTYRIEGTNQVVTVPEGVVSESELLDHPAGDVGDMGTAHRLHHH